MDQAWFTDSHVKDIDGLSSVQEGMLLHTLREPKASVFFLQKILRLKDLDIASFLGAWPRVFDRHRILRSS
jgi:hypothetical protein